MKKTMLKTAACLLALVCSAVAFCACMGGHVHNLTHHKEVAATCTQDGNVEYWSCSGCNKKYLDANATSEVFDVVIKAEHTGETEIRNEQPASEYQDGYSGDTYCLGCGEMLSKGSVLPHTSNAPTLFVSRVIMEDNSVKAVVSIVNSPGLKSLKFSVFYDDILSIQSIEFCKEAGAFATSPQPYINPQPINWINPTKEKVFDGEFLTITFSVNADVTYETDAEIRIIPDEENIFDGDMNTVKFQAVGATVTVNA